MAFFESQQLQTVLDWRGSGIQGNKELVISGHVKLLSLGDKSPHGAQRKPERRGKKSGCHVVKIAVCLLINVKQPKISTGW